MNTYIRIGALVAFLILVILVLKDKQDDKNNGVKIKVITNYNSSVMVTNEDVEKDIFDNFNSNLIGIAFNEISLDELESVVENNPFISEAEVFIDNDDVINIIIAQNIPIARIVKSDGDVFITNNGNIIPLSKHFVPRVMVVSGFEKYDEKINLDTVVINDITRLYKICKYIDKSDFLCSMIGQIDYIEKDNVVLIPKVGNEYIILGNSKNCLENLSRVDIYYDHLVPVKGWGAFSHVDLSIDNQIRGGLK